MSELTKLSERYLSRSLSEFVQDVFEKFSRHLMIFNDFICYSNNSSSGAQILLPHLLQLYKNFSVAEKVFLI